MNEMHRRDFLKASGAGILSTGLPIPLVHSGTATPRSGKVIVSIFLRGGQDALNTIVPHGDEDYYKIRPTIAIPEDKVVKLDDTFGLHPALAPLKAYWDKKLFAPVICAGSNHTTRSHFDAQDFMEYAAPGLRTTREGWLNRYLTVTAGPEAQEPPLRALAMQSLLPRALRGNYPVLAVPDLGRGRGGNILDEFHKLYGEDGMGGMEKPVMTRRKGDELSQQDAVKQAGRVTIRALRRYQKVVTEPTRRRRGKGAYPSGRIGDKLAKIAQVIKSGEPMEVASIGYNGWDHHTNEGAMDGSINRMLEHLAQSLDAFMKDLGQHADRTLVLTMTEFGRTCRENGNRGTDHGHGSTMLALGGSVNGGKVFGDWPGLADKSLYQGRDLRVTTDFRNVMADALRGHMGADLPRDFFPNYALPKPMGLFG